ncbi:MAG: TetR/AcrR family transcriptional regulator [Deltaproteobacteria bacterium]|nr:TetR/AcrR family transcriptional regulator [Deltaproteobacteria bacterium]
MKINKKRLEELCTCAGFQDRITVYASLGRGIHKYVVKLGEVRPWTYSEFEVLVNDVREMLAGHEGPITYDLTAPQYRKRAAEVRRAQILNTAVNIASEEGIDKLSQYAVAARVGCSPSLVRNYFSAEELHQAVMRQAIKWRILSIIAHGVTTQDPVIMESDINLKVEALNGSIK